VTLAHRFPKPDLGCYHLPIQAGIPCHHSLGSRVSLIIGYIGVNETIPVWSTAFVVDIAPGRLKPQAELIV